jgi:hypothetical protein
LQSAKVKDFTSTLRLHSAWGGVLEYGNITTRLDGYLAGTADTLDWWIDGMQGSWMNRCVYRWISLFSFGSW